MKLRKYKYTGPSNTRPKSSSDQSTAKSQSTSPPVDSRQMDILGLKSEICSLKTGDKIWNRKISQKILIFFKSELQAVKSEIINKTTVQILTKWRLELKRWRGAINMVRWSGYTPKTQRVISRQKWQNSKRRVRIWREWGAVQVTKESSCVSETPTFSSTISISNRSVRK